MSRPVKNLFLIIGLFTLNACNKRVDNFELEYRGDQLSYLEIFPTNKR
jgi:hypothetical protein